MHSTQGIQRACFVKKALNPHICKAGISISELLQDNTSSK